MKYTEELLLERNPQAVKAAQYLIRKFPKKYTGEYLMIGSAAFLCVKSRKNRCKYYFRSRVRVMG